MSEIGSGPHFSMPVLGLISHFFSNSSPRSHVLIFVLTFLPEELKGSIKIDLAAAKSLQLCPTPWDPIDSSPAGSAIPGILQARTLEWVAILSPLGSACLNSMQSTSWETLGWRKHKLESRLPGEISITSDMQMTPPLWQKVKKNQRASWWKWHRRVKSWLKAQHSEN